MDQINRKESNSGLCGSDVELMFQNVYIRLGQSLDVILKTVRLMFLKLMALTEVFAVAPVNYQNRKMTYLGTYMLCFVDIVLVSNCNKEN